ncbi:hypothetical protein N665_1235s0003 [Sinapis alba]|nr:hypothetical protein N665_1235s0003 [Sinapis alba]
MGLYGMGGVGKTILLEQINHKLSSIKSSDELLIWVSASKYLRVDKIQDEISKILGLIYEKERWWKQKTESEKSIIIYNYMRRKRFFLLLNDIWEKVDLRKIGVSALPGNIYLHKLDQPHPTRENRCKIVFTTRSLEELLRYHKLANSVQRLSIVEAKRNLVLSTTDGLIDLTIRSYSTLKVEVQRSSTSRSFLNLSTVCISSCDGLKELTWLLFAPNLTVLELWELQRLETLDLSDLPMLKQIYWSALLFPCLRSIKARRCPKLRKLPLDSKSCDLGKTFAIQCNDKNWIESIQWKDRATKARFKSSCLKVHLLSSFIYSDYEQTECFFIYAFQ